MTSTQKAVHPGSTAPARPTEAPAPGEQAQPVAIPDETKDGRPEPPALKVWEPEPVRVVSFDTAFRVYADTSADLERSERRVERMRAVVRAGRDMRRAFKASVAENRTLKKTIRELTRERDEANQNATNLLAGLDEVRTACNQYGIVTGSLVERVHALAKRPAHLVEENRTLQAEIAALQRRVEELTRERCAGQEAS